MELASFLDTGRLYVIGDIHGRSDLLDIALKGNHELMFESFLADPQVADQWRRFGGLETMASYGIPVGALMLGRKYDQASEALRAAVPRSHLEFIADLRMSLTVGPYFLCHAGIRPGIALERQSADDLLWIREPFLGSKADFGKIVVHGHTPSEKPELRPNRINVDTGAYMTSRLTCVALGRDKPRFFSA